MICALGALAVVHAVAPDLDESSGLAVSGDVVWTLEDSGGAPALYALDMQGKLLGASPVPGATNRDWEALSAGVCPDDAARRCLFIGDIGDNKRKREEVRVVVVREPTPGQPAEPVATWHLRYPDQPHNAETLMVDPAGEVWILTKEPSGHSQVLRVPHHDGLLQHEGDVDVSAWSGDLSPKLTGGDQVAAGVVLRTYAELFVWRGDMTRWWERPPDQRVDTGRLAQAESVAVLDDGSLLTTSEGVPMPMVRVECAE